MVGLTLAQSDWQSALPVEVATSMRPLLLETGSLTQALNHICGQEVQVNVLREAFLEEGSAYQVSNGMGRLYWIREVVLFCCDVAVLYAVSKIVFQNIQERDDFLSGQHAFAELQTLGTRPLGYWLMQYEWVRSKFDYAMIEASALEEHLAIQFSDRLPARRSFLFREGQSLELVEVFLPSASCEN